MHFFKTSQNMNIKNSTVFTDCTDFEDLLNKRTPHCKKHAPQSAQLPTQNDKNLTYPLPIKCTFHNL